MVLHNPCCGILKHTYNPLKPFLETIFLALLSDMFDKDPVIWAVLTCLAAIGLIPDTLGNLYPYEL